MSTNPTDSDLDQPEREEDDAVIGRAFLGSAAVFTVIGLLVFAAYWILSGKKETNEVVVNQPTVPEIFRAEFRPCEWSNRRKIVA
jgi:hypothetical protein